MIRSFGVEKEQLLRNLARIQDRASTAQTQLTTGYRINTASDSPQDLTRLTGLQSQIARAVQTRANLEQVKTEVDGNEAMIRTAVKILDEAKTAGSRGADNLTTPAERAVLAERVRSWHSELVRLSNTHQGGRYQFAGDLDGQAPYQVDWTNPGGVQRLHNAPNTRMIEDVTGNRLAISRRAQDIFDLRGSADEMALGNVFNAVYELARGLEDGDTDTIEAGLVHLEDAAEHLNQELGSFGTLQNRVNSALEEAKKAELMATTNLAELREADATAAILDLQQSSISLDAALGAHASISRKTLFDYLG